MSTITSKTGWSSSPGTICESEGIVVDQVVDTAPTDSHSKMRKWIVNPHLGNRRVDPPILSMTQHHLTDYTETSSKALLKAIGS